jgi:hypothetical protein
LGTIYAVYSSNISALPLLHCIYEASINNQKGEEMKKRNQMKWILMGLSFVIVFAAIGVSTASAKIAGYNVLFIHGFVPEDLLLNPSDEEIYARRTHSSYFRERSEGFLNWSSAERVEGKISEQLLEQAKVYSAQGLGNEGCVLVTVSTGDQVARHFIENQAAWLENAGYQPLNIIATLDFVGAGGGTDMADLAVGAAFLPAATKTIVALAFGLSQDLDNYNNLGVINDLTYNGARSLSMAPNDVPRLRFSAGGNEGLDVINPMSQLIRGEDDTLIPASSTCGASSPAGIESCSDYVNYEGKQGHYNGPDGLLYNHFPVLMANGYSHYTLADDANKGKATYVYNNFNAGLNVDFDTYTKTVTRRWWQFWIETGTWQYVTDSDTKSVVRLVYETLNE